MNRVRSCKHNLHISKVLQPCMTRILKDLTNKSYFILKNQTGKGSADVVQFQTINIVTSKKYSVKIKKNSEYMILRKFMTQIITFYCYE